MVRIRTARLTCRAGSHAALSLWHGSSLTGFHLERFIVPIWHWRWIAPLLAAPVAVATLRNLSTLLNAAAWLPFGVPLLVLCTAGSFASILFAWLWYRGRRFFRARAFAPVYAGMHKLFLACFLSASFDANEKGSLRVLICAISTCQ